MKFSVGLAQYYGSEGVDFKSIPKERLLHSIGEQLGAVEDCLDWSLLYKGIVVARVVSCDDHPDADRLHVCMIDDGGVAAGVERDDNGYVQVVCGAPNVRRGLFVAWLPPGSTVPSSIIAGDPFVLEARKLRGVVSNGMLASAKELAIGDDHEGILEVASSDLGREIMVGEPLSEVFELDDFVIDCENKMFTHRPDCFGNLGIAREIAGMFGQKFKSPSWYTEVVDSRDLPADTVMSIVNNCPDLVVRFMAQYIEDVEVRNSPYWMQASLNRVGIKPVNNIVDWSNYYMHLTAQPTHAFDYDKLCKVAGRTQFELGPRMAREGEKLALLGGKEIELTSDDIVISCDDKPVALAGVMGGSETEVDQSTRNIIIECATFDMYTIRRTSMRHGLFTEAVTRYTKDQSPWQNPAVLAKIAADISDQTGSIPYAAQDLFATGLQLSLPIVQVDAGFINKRLGSNIPASQMKQILGNVEIEADLDGDVLSVHVPFWRMDLHISEDIVEEIGRLHGYSNLPSILPSRSTSPPPKNNKIAIKQKIRNSLSRAGANEVLSYSFVHERILRQSEQNPDQAFRIANALSPGLEYYRLSLLPSLLDKVHANIKNGYDEFVLFEIGKTHNKQSLSDDGLPIEFDRVDAVYASKTVKQGAAYYRARCILEQLLKDLDVSAVYREANNTDFPDDDPDTAPFDLERSVVIESVDGAFIGLVGEIKHSVRKGFKLPDYVAAWTLDISAISNAASGSSKYRAISKYPSVSQDISLRVPQNVSYGQLATVLKDEIVNSYDAASNIVSNISLLDIYQKSGDSYKTFTFRVNSVSHNKTLVNAEMSQILDGLAEAGRRSYDAIRV